MDNLRAVLFGTAQEYSEPVMAFRAVVFMAPVILAPWGPWWGALTIWLAAAALAYIYGKSLRHVEDT
jgi:hypothetical protein